MRLKIWRTIFKIAIVRHYDMNLQNLKFVAFDRDGFCVSIKIL